MMRKEFEDEIIALSKISHDHPMWKKAAMSILLQVREYQSSFHDDKDVWHNINAYTEVENLKFELLKIFAG